jgi:hypothetical protein
MGMFPKLTMDDFGVVKLDGVSIPSVFSINVSLEAGEPAKVFIGAYISEEVYLDLKKIKDWEYRNALRQKTE